LKLRLPWSDKAWTAAYLLAGPVMLASIAGVALVGHLLLGLGWGAALLLGAVLAPTDPVLASAVTVSSARDQDRMRYGLSGEAGFNDGAAFPFVVFALEWLGHGGPGSWIGGWALHRVVWAVPAGLVIGYFLGVWLGRLAIHLRGRSRGSGAPGDFLALALIALSYSAAESVGAWGFLATFAAGLGFRRSEVETVEAHPAPVHLSAQAAGSLADAPAEELVGMAGAAENLEDPTKAAGHMVAEIISFGDTAERLLEVMLVVVLGICVASYWDWRAVPLGLALFVVIRPLGTLAVLGATATRRSQRWLMGWFGIRGIGSLYYLSYALNHGLSAQSTEVVGMTLTVVALSVILHGVTSPLLEHYERATARRRG
jgi:NhaP-type Na+/H+ or K+/H+ antiporter